MRLSRKKSIELCILVWTWLAKTGKRKKEDWPGWLKYYKTLKSAETHVWGFCWFCEYDERQKKKNDTTGGCFYCPLTEKFSVDGCNDNQSYFTKWVNARFPRTRKKYAGLFLKQILELK